MGSHQKARPNRFDYLVQKFPSGVFILNVFNEIILNPLKLKGIITYAIVN